MSLKFWTGCAGSGKSTRLYNYIIEESDKHPELTYIVVVPEQYNLQAQKDFIRLHPRHGVINIDVVSFTRLAHRVFEETGYGADGGKVIDDMGKNLIIRRISQSNVDKLPVLGPNLNKLGYITEVKSVISEFMQYGINTDMAYLLASEAEKSGKGQLSAKLKDISFIYTEFLEAIKQRYTTREELLIRLSKVLTESEKIKNCIVAFDGFTGFTPVQLTVIENLMLLCREVHVALTIDRREDTDNDISIREHELFYLGKRTISQLGRIADRNHVRICDEDRITDEIPKRLSASGGKRLPHLERNLFRDISKEFPCTDDNNLGDEIHIICGLNLEEELELNARRINKLIQEKGYKYSDIALITGDIEIYRNDIERTLSRHNIPFFIDKTQPVLLNPMIEYLRAAISILSDNYSYEAIFRLLKCGLTDIPREEIDILENYCIATGVKGRSNWNRPFAKIPALYRRSDAEQKTEYLRQINAIREKVISIIKALEEDIDESYSSRKKEETRIYTNAFYRMLDREDIGRKIKQKSIDFEAEGRLSEAASYDQIFARIMGVFEQLTDLLGDEKLYVKEFGQLMDAGLDEIRIGIIPKNTDYVQVGDITRSRLREVKALFVVGVNDGIVPTKVSGSGFLSDADKSFFMDKADNISFAPSARENAYTQRLYLYMMFSKPSEYLSLSFSKINVSGESHRPSYIIKTVMGMFPDLRIEYADKELVSIISGKNATYKALISNMGEYITGAIETNILYEELIKVYGKDDMYSDMLSKLIDKRITEETEKNYTGKIGRAVAEALYGKRLYSSVTKLEAYAQCAYEYYLQYGLGLSPREEFDFAGKDLGTVFHASLEQYTQKLKKMDTDISQVDDETSQRLIGDAVEYAVASEDMAALYSTKRTSYMVKRIKRIMEKTVSILKYQASKGMFKPYNVEVDFAKIDSLDALNLKLSEDETLKMSGRIDRIDTYTEDDKTYVRIIDYKSSSKDIDIAAVYEGRELQLVVYLDAAMELIGKETGKKTVPAGILYYHVDDPIVNETKVKNVTEIENEVRKKLKMHGYVNSDLHVIRLMDSECETGVSDVIPVGIKKDNTFRSGSKVLSTEEFCETLKGARAAIEQMGKSILDGEIATAIEKGDIEKHPDTCKYCEYKAVCHQKPGYTGSEEDTSDSDANEEVED